MISDRLLRASIDVDRALVARGGLYDFVRMAWPLVEPSPFIGNWHIQEVCTHLEAVSRGEIHRLLVNQPPGTGKSLVINVFWPIWDWLSVTEGRSKWIYASYDASLVGTRDGGRVVKILTSDWFLDRWAPMLEPGKAATSNFNTRPGGFRYATSVAGAVLGRHADIQVVDDPIKPKDALGGATISKNMIKAVSDWWRNTMSSRATDQRTFRRVIVMQRLTDDDLAGEMLLTGEYTHLRLPMTYDPKWPCKTAWGGDRRTEPGDLLFHERYPPAIVASMRVEAGESVWASQYEQTPQVAGGGIFKREWWRFWHYVPGMREPCLCEDCFKRGTITPGHIGALDCAVLPEDGQEIQSWDLAFKGEDSSDPVAGLVLRIAEPCYYALDCTNEPLSYVQTRAKIRATSKKWPKTYTKLVEDKANGPAIENDLKKEIPGITLVNPSGGKVARANAASPVLEAGRYILPHPSICPWVWPYLKQHESFPVAAFDDMVDATTQALVRLRAHGSAFQDAMRKLRGEK